MASEQKKPKRRSVKNAKRVSSGTASTKSSPEEKQTPAENPTLEEKQAPSQKQAPAKKPTPAKKPASAKKPTTAKKTASVKKPAPAKTTTVKSASPKPASSPIVAPEISGEVLVATEKALGASGNIPSVNEKTPSVSVQTPRVNERPSSASGRIPRVNEGAARKREAVKRKKKLPWLKIVLVSLLAVLVVLAGLFVWNRWYRYDDIQDFQGEWTYINEGASTTVNISDKSISFAQNIEYEYQLNTQDKEVIYDFGNLEGAGRYRFSADRNTLVIAEDAEGDWLVDLQVSLGFTEPEEGYDPEKITVLKRIS